jgi:hypothetical protein
MAAVPLERRVARASRAGLLPLADKFGDQLMQFLDARPDEVASEAARPLIAGGGVRLLTDRECLKALLMPERQPLRRRVGRPPARPAFAPSRRRDAPGYARKVR